MPGSNDAFALVCLLHMCLSCLYMFTLQHMVRDLLLCLSWSRGPELLKGASKFNTSYGTSTGHEGEAWWGASGQVQNWDLVSKLVGTGTAASRTDASLLYASLLDGSIKSGCDMDGWCLLCLAAPLPAVGVLEAHPLNCVTHLQSCPQHTAGKSASCNGQPIGRATVLVQGAESLRSTATSLCW